MYIDIKSDTLHFDSTSITKVVKSLNNNLKLLPNSYNDNS